MLWLWREIRFKSKLNCDLKILNAPLLYYFPPCAAWDYPERKSRVQLLRTARPTHVIGFNVAYTCYNLPGKTKKIRQCKFSGFNTTAAAAAGQERRDRASCVRRAVVSLWLLIRMRVVSSGCALRRSKLRVFRLRAAQSAQRPGMWETVSMNSFP